MKRQTTHRAPAPSTTTAANPIKASEPFIRRIFLIGCALIVYAGPVFGQGSLPPVQERPGAARPAPSQIAAKYPFPTAASELLLIGAQVQGRGAQSEQEVDFSVAVELPGPARLFERRSEAQFFDNLRQEAKTRLGGGRFFFPEYARISKEEFRPRNFPPMLETVEPLVLQHGRLFFEQPNFDRQGWDLGILTPAVNLGVFYYDLVALPYHYWSRPQQRCESSAGKCLPGDPTPLYLYREPFSITGLAGQAATLAGGFFIFP